MNKLLVLVCVLFLTVGSVMAQVWTYDSDFKTKAGKQPHGIVVDANGRIWIGYYAVTDTMGGVNVMPIYVYEPNGDPASFSPIRTYTLNAKLDTIKTGCRGLALDHNGNVIFTGSQIMIRFNYQTGEAMNKYSYPYGAAGSLTSAAVDDNGFVYVTMVVPSKRPLVILDEDFTLYGNVVDSLATIQRSLLVSGDGKYVYVPTIYAGDNGVRVYYGADGPDGTYALVDTLGTFTDVGGVKHIMWGQAADWDNNGLMWVGTYWDVGKYGFSGWYALDPTQNYAIVDQVGANAAPGGPLPNPITIPVGGTYYSPRHAAWSLDGTVMYTNDFDAGVTKKWTNTSPAQPGAPVIDPNTLVSIDYDRNGNPTLAVSFNLGQNYPNPFNPSTNIPFDLSKNYQVKLNVYDMLGRLVATLVDQPLAAGHHSYQFDGSNLSSGTYFYQLHVDGQVVTKQMLMVK